MDMDKNGNQYESRMAVSDFTSAPVKNKREQWRKSVSQRNRNEFEDGRNSNNNDKKERSVYMLVRLGVCALCFCTVLALKLSDTDNSAMVLSSLNSALNDEYSPDGELGRLRFVQLPSIIDVFAPSDTPIMPVTVLGIRTMEDNTLLCITTSNGADVIAVLDCTVKAIGRDEQHGDYVKVICQNDIEICYYGVTSIIVEEGQPITQNSKLGITEGEELLIRVFDTGRPIDTAKYFDIKVS